MLYTIILLYYYILLELYRYRIYTNVCVYEYDIDIMYVRCVRCVIDLFVYVYYMLLYMVYTYMFKSAM